MLDLLIEYGFHREDFVYEPGEFSIRGGIVDVFSFGNELPYRIELLGDEVDSLRTFDPESQISAKKITSLNIIPNINEQFDRDAYSDIFEFLPKNLTIWLEDLGQFKSTLVNYAEKAADEFERLQKVDVHHHPFHQKTWQQFFMNVEELVSKIGENRLIVLSNNPQNIPLETIQFKTQPQPDFNRNFEMLIEHLKSNTKAG